MDNNKNNKMDNDNDKKKDNSGCGCLLFVLVLVGGGFTWLNHEVGLSAAFWILWVVVGLVIVPFLGSCGNVPFEKSVHAEMFPGRPKIHKKIKKYSQNPPPLFIFRS